MDMPRKRYDEYKFEHEKPKELQKKDDEISVDIQVVEKRIVKTAEVEVS